MIKELMNIRIQPFDHQYLTSLLNGYRYPRNKIAKMIASGEIVQLKRGLYVLGEKYQKNYIPELAANLLYGPSYISTDYALRYYSMIPERVFSFTSVTTSRKKIYHTPVGSFFYQQLKPEYYNTGYVFRSADNLQYLIATAEKALCDKLYFLKSQEGIEALEQLLYEDLRIEPETIKSLRKTYVKEFAKRGGNKNINLLYELVREKI